MKKKTKRKQPKPESWRLPKTYKSPKPDKNDVVTRTSGEPTLYPLKRFEGDNSLTADAIRVCCDCGLSHLYVHNVFRSPDGNWYLQIRPYRL